MGYQSINYTIWNFYKNGCDVDRKPNFLKIVLLSLFSFLYTAEANVRDTAREIAQLIKRLDKNASKAAQEEVCKKIKSLLKGKWWPEVKEILTYKNFTPYECPNLMHK